MFGLGQSDFHECPEKGVTWFMNVSPQFSLSKEVESISSWVYLLPVDSFPPPPFNSSLVRCDCGFIELWVQSFLAKLLITQHLNARSKFSPTFSINFGLMKLPNSSQEKQTAIRAYFEGEKAKRRGFWDLYPHFVCWPSRAKLIKISQ